jgi:hypothetical protein
MIKKFIGKPGGLVDGIIEGKFFLNLDGSVTFEFPEGKLVHSDKFSTLAEEMQEVWEEVKRDLL